MHLTDSPRLVTILQHTGQIDILTASKSVGKERNILLVEIPIPSFTKQCCNAFTFALKS